ncbi:hypothetical protein FHS07_001610 [Microbacterium proteolyticum]|uniref:Uncharacterized protein n=1 Tax=Microbacterium proteolyticum TaxID=1572644 RepID=A0A7W5CHT8_9MICO|nr:hypothetical protein [Microbacterium proteolyticum]MBB3157926.1 hypothetical protein [Microbacterium proteolyticum]
MVTIVMLLSVTCLVATGVLLLVGLLLVGRDGSTGASLQYATIAGVAEVSASAMYLVWINVGGSAAFAAANALMVLGPAIIPFAFHALSPARGNRWFMLIAAAGVVAVAVTSLVLPVDEAAIVRAATFAVVGVCGALAALRSRHAHRASIRLLAGALGVFALYCTARAIVLGAAGGADGGPAGVFSDTGAVAVGIVIIVVTTAATSVFWIAVGRETLLAAAGASAVLVIVPGRQPGDTGRLPRFRELVDDVREAATAIDSDAVAVFGGAGLSRPGAATALKDTLRIDHGWTEEEIALLTQTTVAH